MDKLNIELTVDGLICNLKELKEKGYGKYVIVWNNNIPITKIEVKKDTKNINLHI